MGISHSSLFRWRAFGIGTLAGLGLALAYLLLVGRHSVVAGATAAPSLLKVDYPLNQSIFPPDMEPPTFLWHDPAANAAVWKIDVTFTRGREPLHLTSNGLPMPIGQIDPRCIGPTNKPPELSAEEEGAHTWKPDEATWSLVRKYAVDQPATVTIAGFTSVDSAQPVSRGQMQLTISSDPVGAPIFYRDVPLMPSATENGVIKPLASSAVPLINWRLRDVGRHESRIVMNDLHTCANCHSFSRDGKTLGMDMDGPQNDKGLYALVPISQRTVIDTKDMISWSSFRKELDPQLRVGFMSQVSPDGRYVATTVKPPHTTSAQFYYVSNFADYRFLQVFYPTRGVLAVYDRQTRDLKPLPGADNPALVQASAVWTPDGKYLVFLHAIARDPYPANGIPAKFPNDPNEVQIQYDLYRIPFNDGKGGVAEPIEGASQNGMSNSFAKVSPDGKWLVYVQAKNGLLMRPDSKLWIIPANGGKARLMKCNTSLMNSWHSWSPNSRWLVFSSKSRGPYTKMFLTHVDENGNDSPAILIENSTAANRAVNIPEFVNRSFDDFQHIDTPAVDFYKQYDVAEDFAKRGDFARAIPEWHKALQMEPDDARARNAFGETLARTGKNGDALEQFRLAVQQKPQFAEAHNNLAVVLASMGKPAEAQTEFDLAISANPGYADAHNNLGRLLFESHRIDQALEQFRFAIELNPGYAEAHNNLGYALASQGSLEQAIAEYKKAIESDDKYAHAYNNLGLAFATLGELDNAIANFQKAVEVDPAYASAEGNLGRALLQQNQLEGAIVHLRRGAELGPPSADVETSLGLALAQNNQIADAIPHFEQAVKLAPQLVQGQYYLGESLMMTGRIADGLAHWRQGLQREPDNPQLLNETAWLLATTQDKSIRNGPESLAMAKRAVALTQGQRPEFLGTLAAAYAEMGNFSDAIAVEEKAADLARSQQKPGLAKILEDRLAQFKAGLPMRH